MSWLESQNKRLEAHIKIALAAYVQTGFRAPQKTVEGWQRPVKQKD